MSNLLIDDYPIQVLPKLAKEIGLNEAIILQQVHYWLKDSNHIHDKRKWIYNTYEEWNNQFCFWSIATIRRTIKSLEKQKLLNISNYNKAGFDKTKWYSIDYEEVERVSRRCAQNEQTMCSKRADGSAQNEQMEALKMSKPIPETNTETNSKTTSENKQSSNSTPYPFQSIIEYLNERTGKHYKYTTKKTQSLIKARFKEGFTEAEFRHVIDTKTNEWKGTTKFERYLRPETLFGNKFESYLNQKTELQGETLLDAMQDPKYWD